jgi:hypothetical protein
VRFFGCGGDLQGVNGDYFTVGDSGGEDISLPAALRREGPTKLRFSRGAERWRVTAADNLPLYVNQRRTVGLTDIVSGDVVRLKPGGPGLQFLMRQQDATLARLATRLAPRRPATPPEDRKTAPEDRKAAPQPAQPAAPTRGMPGPKDWAIAIAIGVALLLAYLAGSIRSASPHGTAPSSTEASE